MDFSDRPKYPENCSHHLRLVDFIDKSKLFPLSELLGFDPASTTAVPAEHTGSAWALRWLGTEAGVVVDVAEEAGAAAGAEAGALAEGEAGEEEVVMVVARW